MFTALNDLRALIMRERRATLLALQAWSSVCENDSRPDLNELSNNAVKAGKQDVFTENQFLIKIDRNTENSVFMFYGNALPKVPGRRNVGINVKNFLPNALKDIFLDACEETVDSDKEVDRQGEITTASGESVLYRSIFMPLRSDNLEYNYIFGVFSHESGATDLIGST